MQYAEHQRGNDQCFAIAKDAAERSLDDSAEGEFLKNRWLQADRNDRQAESESVVRKSSEIIQSFDAKVDQEVDHTAGEEISGDRSADRNQYPHGMKPRFEQVENHSKGRRAPAKNHKGKCAAGNQFRDERTFIASDYLPSNENGRQAEQSEIQPQRRSDGPDICMILLIGSRNRGGVSVTVRALSRFRVADAAAAVAESSLARGIRNHGW